MFAYPLPSIPTHFQPILIENQLNPIGIDPTSETTLKTNFPSSDRGGHPKSDLLSAINAQGPCIDWIVCFELLCIYRAQVPDGFNTTQRTQSRAAVRT